MDNPYWTDPAIDELCPTLLENLKNCVETGSFTLSSGHQSSYYLNTVALRTNGHTLERLSDFISMCIAKFYGLESFIVGREFNAAYFVHCLSIFLDNDCLIVRKNNTIEGHFDVNKDCVVFEDVVTTGSQLLDTVHTLEKAKLNVTGCLSLVERDDIKLEKPLIEELKTKYHYQSLFKMSEILESP